MGDLEKKLSKPLIDTASITSQKACESREVVEFILNVPALFESLRLGRADLLCPSLKTEQTQEPQLEYAEDSELPMLAAGSVEFDFVFKVNGRRAGEFPISMTGNGGIDAEGHFALYVHDCSPSFAHENNSFPLHTPHMAISFDGGQCYSYFERSATGEITLRPVRDIVPSRNLYSLMGVYNMDRAVESYRNLVFDRLNSFERQGDVKLERVLRDKGRLVSYSVVKDGREISRTSMTWDSGRLKGASINVQPVRTLIRDKNFAYDVTIHEEGRLQSSKRVYPEIPVVYPPSERQVLVTFELHSKLGVVPGSITMKDVYGVYLDITLDRVRESEKLHGELRKENFSHWKAPSELYRLSSKWLMVTLDAKARDSIERLMNSVKSHANTNCRASSTRSLVLGALALGQHEKATETLTKLSDMHRSNGDLRLSQLELEAACFWMCMQGFRTVAETIAEKLLHVYKTDIEKIDVEGTIAALARRRHPGLVYVLAEMARRHVGKSEDLALAQTRAVLALARVCREKVPASNRAFVFNELPIRKCFGDPLHFSQSVRILFNDENLAVRLTDIEKQQLEQLQKIGAAGVAKGIFGRKDAEKPHGNEEGISD